MAEAGREEAFGALIEEITRQQREAGMPFEDALTLQRLICAYGSACAREARVRAWETLRPQGQRGGRPPVRVVRQIDGVEWVE